MEQTTLFQIPVCEPASVQAVDAEAKPDFNALDEICFIYTATAKGNNSGIRFALSRQDAEKWCSWDGSRGVLHGTQWAFFFTTATNFMKHHFGDEDMYGVSRYKLDISKLKDDGSWDERISNLGLKKIPLTDFKELLEPHGIEVIE